MPEEERPQDQLAEAELLGHAPPYLAHGNAQHPPSRAGRRAEIDPLPGEEANLAKELRPAVRRDNRLPRLAAALDNLGFTGQKHDQVIGHITVGEQHIPGGYVVLPPLPSHHLKLRTPQDRAAPPLTLLRTS